ncbi:DUF4280 domain-containing protein [Bordetella flabilis]|uniref:DUF4280 domain-containing protein n=1 Tax=Bordetella flabilis TaxID=463014 RepID=A0A193GAM0_9BORD|nr:DUF4280 domain-containing protein [Bordetella flabilis]ANN76678.1 hypothetical protein BAU07_05695 [Bordetella flabilis]
MSQQVVMGAQLLCTFGTMPAVLAVLPESRVMVEERPAATIMDHEPIVNIPTFGMCASPANPEVAAATAAAMGVLTPMPCVPATVTPWLPGAPTVLIGGQPALDNLSRCMCMWEGVVSIAMAGSVRTMVP